ncbi:phospholipase A2 inhibitor and Ly6/PLAUR domain-containing protein-like [Dama dama]|uniref:phospholipase A2 inhibitor and Ly6/PLAUR domain-containing protein-like n=1 Tax=Dama dama TaxID=30532 RepID=UPI002A36A395|nr:phospholipase A2 inhibitor and Ly6/PLAUR domain-containing protein-like [Dama dama]XP_060991813.1 phospholipase A2 inhibitor and Ly6/PLAUR domain-containing protein-like [Dama dama]XP_060994207.1 phospholipase A2 inhibitor and Ly6/PLAUR domain-containing protein-like [Dama dama]XP_060994208.1 phospholipase A2 inhibitor and Ly6/PLAUR domain-containing protein-like [Dama dama]
MKPSMKPETFLLGSALLCTLLGLGYPLSCEVCTSDGPNCSGKLQTCAPDEDSCMVVLTESYRKGSLAVTSYKGCAKSSECDSGSFAITMNTENYMGSRRRCCQDDGCNKEPMPAIVRNHTENGLRCPSCIAAFTETCTSTQEAVCVGEETHCVAVSGLAQPGIKFAARGCGTETACHIKPGTLVPSGSRLLTIKKTSCRPSPQASGKAE